MIKLSEEQFSLLSKLDDIEKFILNVEHKTEYASEKVITAEYFVIQVKDLSKFQDQIFFNVVEYGMDNEGKVNDYGEKIYDLYDTILEQI